MHLTKPTSKISAGERLALVVRIGRDLYALPIMTVEEVLPALPVEPLPRGPGFVRGVVFVRGHLIPVVEAAERLGLTDHEREAEPNIVCLRVGGRLIGIEVDEALDLLDVGQGISLDVEEVGRGKGFFAGVVEMDGKIIRLLDPEQLATPGLDPAQIR